MRVLFLLHQSCWAWVLPALHCRLGDHSADHHVAAAGALLLEGSPGRSPQTLARDLGPHCCQAAGLEGDAHRREQRGFRVGFARSRGRAGLPPAPRGWPSGLTRGLAGLTRLAQGKRHSWRSSRCEPARAHSWAARTSSCQRRRTKRGGVAGLRDACGYAFASLRDTANCDHQVLCQVLPSRVPLRAAETLRLGGAPAPPAAPP